MNAVLLAVFSVPCLLLFFCVVFQRVHSLPGEALPPLLRQDPPAAVPPVPVRLRRGHQHLLLQAPLRRHPPQICHQVAMRRM